MRRMLMAAGVAAALATAPSLASARSACDQRAHDRKVTGTIVGAIGGGLLGNAVASRGVKTEGTLLGAGVGAVVGNQVSRVKCDRGRSYTRTRTYAPRSTATRANYRYAGGPSGPAACRYKNRPYYDERGRLVYAPTQVCR